MKSGISDSDPEAGKSIFDIQSGIGAIQSDPLLFDGKNFDQRTEAIDFIEFQIIDQIEELLAKTSQPQLLLLKYLAEKVKYRLEEIDNNLFLKLKEDIRKGKYTGKNFMSLVNEYVDFNLGDNEHQGEPGYDNLDAFLNGLLSLNTMPEPTRDLEPEMVFYQKRRQGSFSNW